MLKIERWKWFFPFMSICILIGFDMKRLTGWCGISLRGGALKRRLSIEP
jgi:hypothetical protein